MCINPRTMLVNGEEVTVSCGKCILCKRKKCREWAVKLYNESQYHKKMCMLTLTFRPKFLLRPKLKELTKYKTRKKEDGTREKIKINYKTLINPKYITDVKLTGWLITLFIKKLRKHFTEKNNINFSYFAVGEHGSQNTHRAHWHIIFFGLDKDILQSMQIGNSKKGKAIYFSPLIHNLWSYEKMNIGQHTISEVTNATIKYVANYTMKKMYKNYERNEKYTTTMRFSNTSKMGIKWARKFHRELRKGYIQDNEGKKYPIPKRYKEEMKKYTDSIFYTCNYNTLCDIESYQDELMKRLKSKGLLSKEELMKKAKVLENRYKKQDRDTI